VDQLARPGDAVKPGGVLARVHAADQTQADAACYRLEAAFQVSAQSIPAALLICEVLE